MFVPTAMAIQIRGLAQRTALTTLEPTSRQGWILPRSVPCVPGHTAGSVCHSWG